MRNYYFAFLAGSVFAPNSRASAVFVPALLVVHYAAFIAFGDMVLWFDRGTAERAILVFCRSHLLVGAVGAFEYAYLIDFSS